MGFFGTFSDFLTGSVGNNLDNDEGDVRNTKRNLKNTGHLDDDVENGYATRELDEGIKSFQRDNGLKIDGTLLPGGETERGLFGTLTGRSADAVFGRKSEKNDGDIIGFGGNVSGISERKKPTYKRPKYSTVFVPPLDSEKEQTEKSNPFTITRGGMRVNKDKIADGIEKFLLAAVQGEEVPLPTKKPVLTTVERKEAILNDEEKNFKIVSNNKADSESPWYRRVLKNEVKIHEKIINKEAKKSKIDPDLVKAIVYLETSQGYYDEWAPDKLVKTIRPMNVYASYWKGLGYSRKDLKDPEKNIQAGIKLLKRIKKNTPHADVAKIATLYNSLGARTVDNYGAQVERIYNEKPWKDKK